MLLPKGDTVVDPVPDLVLDPMSDRLPEFDPVSIIERDDVSERSKYKFIFRTIHGSGTFMHSVVRRFQQHSLLQYSFLMYHMRLSEAQNRPVDEMRQLENENYFHAASMDLEPVPRKHYIS